MAVGIILSVRPWYNVVERDLCGWNPPMAQVTLIVALKIRGMSLNPRLADRQPFFALFAYLSH